MSNAPTLLGADGAASVATMFMMAHHGFRRDLAQFRAALPRLAGDHAARASAIAEEWTFFRGALHAHHEMEDKGLFPQLAGRDASLGPVIAQLGTQHRLIDPMLERGDALFARLDDAAAREGARALVAEMSALLDGHLALEEERIVPSLRALKTLPMPVATDEMAAQMSQGLAWSSHGVAPDVVSAVFALLPESVTTRLPAERAAYAARCERAWGSANAGASRTAVPDLGAE
ncbi:MAG TPA: hemerythrin domain-containing protein [Anaeromyxobacteraceae bacterium]|nr:hemerythrin domain-containing protein [Anaeromyxobacteraceae bacterium]